MRLLLDSHVALWWLAGDPGIGAGCRTRIETADTVLVSVVTPWELGIERSLGKLNHPDGLVEALVRSGFGMLEITAEHADLTPRLPLHHRDQFDRMLIAQARLESLVIVSADGSFDDYGVERLDPRSTT